MKFLAPRSVAFLLMVGMVGQGQSAEAPAKKNLRAFYALNCVVCHGTDGSARAADGSKLKGQDFTNTKDMKGMTDEKMTKAILKGLFFGKRMPAFKDQLSEAEAREMVRQVLRKAEKGKPVYSETP